LLPATAEIVIVGGGVMGASIAYHLSARGARDILLLERGEICSGETAKSGGFIQTHWSSPHEQRLIAYSRERFQEWAEPCRYQQTGYLHVSGAERVEAVRSVHDTLLGQGFHSEWLTPGEIKKLQPLLRVDDLVGGAYEPMSGWADPVATTRWFATQAQSRGAKLVEGVAVRQIARRANKVDGVETSYGYVSTGCVILAAGPWSPQLHPNPELPLPLLVRRGQVCYMNRPGGLPRKELAFYDEITGLYTHPDGETNLVGIDWEFDTLYEPRSYRREVDADYVQAAHAALSHRFPSLRLSQPVRGVVGLYDFTPDGHPIVDTDYDLEGYCVAAGFSGAGFKSSPALGLGIAELVLDGQARSVDLHFLRRSRFDTES
jgi:sarcosine oxidase, subunit beta